MKEMKIWKRLFGNHSTAPITSDETIEPEPIESDEKIEPEPIAPDEPENAPKPYDYGLGVLWLYLRSRDYGWSKPDENHKKVILTNPRDCKEKIDLMSMISTWRGTGHSEWEALMGAWFIQAVIDANEKDADEADITNIFNRDFLASDDRVFTKEQVYDHLIKWFDIVDETEETLKLRVHI